MENHANTLSLAFSDHLGSSSIVTNQEGGITATYDYFPFGGTRIANEEGGLNMAARYTGQELDEATDLYYYGARYYMAGGGGVTQVDPVAQNIATSDRIQEVLAEPQRLNEYSYALNNPVKLIDENGEYAETPLDLIMLALSTRDFMFNPTFGRAIWVGLDALGVVAPIPALGGWIRFGSKAAKILKYFDEVARFAGNKIYDVALTFANNIFFKQNKLRFALGKAGDSLANLVGHFEKHKELLQVDNLDDYYNRANNFF